MAPSDVDHWQRIALLSLECSHCSTSNRRLPHCLQLGLWLGAIWLLAIDAVCCGVLLLPSLWSCSMPKCCHASCFLSPVLVVLVVLLSLRRWSLRSRQWVPIPFHSVVVVVALPNTSWSSSFGVMEHSIPSSAECPAAILAAEHCRCC